MSMLPDAVWRRARSKFVDWKGQKPHLGSHQGTEEFIKAHKEEVIAIQKPRGSNCRTAIDRQLLARPGGVQSLDEHEYPLGGIYYEFNKNPKIEKIYSGFYRSEEWTAKRNEILAGSDGSCVVCGVKENLVVDHLTPLRADWDLRLCNENLQVMCPDCNKEKGSTLNWHLYTHQVYVKWRKERNLVPMLGVFTEWNRKHVEESKSKMAEWERYRLEESKNRTAEIEKLAAAQANKSPMLKKRTSLKPPEVGDIVYEDSGIYASPLIVQKIEWDYVIAKKEGKQWKPKRLKIDSLYVIA